MRRHCARPGCTSRATVTFTFNAHERAVWLDAPREGAPSAGELCDRHACSLTPPHGWTVDDRRHVPPTAPEHPAPTSTHVAAVQPPAPVRDELRQLLDARTPLLARAFLSAGEV